MRTRRVWTPAWWQRTGCWPHTGQPQDRRRQAALRLQAAASTTGSRLRVTAPSASASSRCAQQDRKEGVGVQHDAAFSPANTSARGSCCDAGLQDRLTAVSQWKHWQQCLSAEVCPRTAQLPAAWVFGWG